MSYDEQEVLAFCQDCLKVYIDQHIPVDINAAIWPARMQFDAFELGYPASRAKHLQELKTGFNVVGLDNAVVVNKPINGNWQDWFLGVVADKPFTQQTLLDLEPTLNIAGVQLTPPNSKGERTKIGIPRPDGSTQWIRVGFGEGHWVWLPQ